ncbi:growth-Arrest-Specific protein 2 domain-containing protein [Trichoderma breve]|uniref:Growth-Arrest-Specific protein 2 domain-containing protein n=1 Tax=Trichoderma breve TaxID=2034170 RepID=A0A9W9E692_9HYPO|nr:growth-Arrest-Specific protein 2 domain-containing protein [Trichoderma breve]KAJ4856191.1 growth-Arrest-Specific protein 2 domain-containing protein [Trichoderma breve]
MNETPVLVKQKRLSTPTPGQLLAARQRSADDFFAHLEPAKVVEALSPPDGVLRGCLAEASALERDFAMRTAVASHKIWQWLSELNQWNWPKQAGSGGFLEPSNTQRKLFAQAPTPEETGRKQYMGSLPAEEVEKYETRINQINRDMDDLDLEEIKGHVMNDHILPLSRPGTPMNMDPSRSMLSALSSYHKMEDISVLITAIVVQTLPNLAKLSRLLQLWHMRIIVLRHVNPFLQAIQDVEALLGENWEAISQSHWEMERPSRKAIVLPARTLTSNDFEAKRQSLALKVAEPGRTLDYMLDCLEGAPDTLPDEWLTRMEDVEQGYGEWVSACERKMAEAKLAKSKPKPTPLRKTSSLSPSPTRAHQSANNRDVSPANSGNKLSPPLLLVPGTGESDHGSYLDPIAEDELSSPEDHFTPPEDLAMMEAISEEDELPSSEFIEVSGSPTIPKSRLREAFYPEDDSPPSSPPELNRRLLDSPMVIETPEDDESFLQSTFEDSFLDDFEDSYVPDVPGPPARRESAGEQQLRLQISQIIENIPAKIKLTNGTSGINLNPPDLQLPRLRKKPSKEPVKRSTSGMSTRTATPSFTLSPVKQRTRPKGHYPIRVYHLSRSDNEAPIKLFIRCVGEQGERVMVRVGGGWADLSEYLKEYASHHGRRSNGKESVKVEVRDIPRASNGPSKASPPSRPPTATGDRSSTPVTPGQPAEGTPPSEGSAVSRPSSRLSWAEDESSFLGLAGPKAKKIEMSEESKAWVESIKEKVLMASGPDRKPNEKKFGEIGKAGGTKRVFRRG